MTVSRGRFISLEGLEGVGKTTNREVIESHLQSARIDYIATREPGGTASGEKLRHVVLDAQGSMQAETELMIMVASRIELVASLIEPALQAGQWVLCDRYIDASIAYQGAGRQLGVDRVVELHELMGVTLRPDLTILLDMPVGQGLSRMAARGEPDRIERERPEFFERARAAYLERAQAEPDRFKIIDAAKTLEEVAVSVGIVMQQFIRDSDVQQP